MTAQMPASGLKQAGSMTVITNLSKCGLMTDSGLSGRNVINHAPTMNANKLNKKAVLTARKADICQRVAVR